MFRFEITYPLTIHPSGGRIRDSNHHIIAYSLPGKPIDHILQALNGEPIDLAFPLKITTWPFSGGACHIRDANNKALLESHTDYAQAIIQKLTPCKPPENSSSQ